jgi:cytoskeleton protein RodZ
MESIGQILRRARDENGLTLDEVATRTRINRKYLEAIERGDRESIPGGFFYKSFIRQYAAVVSEKDSHLVDEVEEILAAEEPVAPPEPEDHLLRTMAAKPPMERPASSRNVSAATYLVFLILALAGSSGLYMWWHRAQQAHAAGDVAPAPAPKQTEQQKTEPPPTPPQEVAPSTPPAESPATPAPSPSQDLASNPDAKIVLDVAAVEETWFQVSADGKSVFAGVLKSGESKTFAAKEGARMKVGNAGGLQVKLNGNPIGAIGPSGQIRSVVFTPAGAEVVKPAPPPVQPDKQEPIPQPERM